MTICRMFDDFFMRRDSAFPTVTDNRAHYFAAGKPCPKKQLMQIMETLETHYKDLCDIEFTIERGRLWMLQTRVGKRRLMSRTWRA